MVEFVRFIRKAHRWIAPVFVLAVIAVIITGPPQPATPAQAIQQLLMLLLMLSGIVLFAYPFWARSRKKSGQNSGQTQQEQE
jgi:hypothetical protein